MNSDPQTFDKVKVLKQRVSRKRNMTKPLTIQHKSTKGEWNVLML